MCMPLQISEAEPAPAAKDWVLSVPSTFFGEHMKRARRNGMARLNSRVATTGPASSWTLYFQIAHHSPPLPHPQSPPHRLTEIKNIKYSYCSSYRYCLAHQEPILFFPSHKNGSGKFISCT